MIETHMGDQRVEGEEGEGRDSRSRGRFTEGWELRFQFVVEGG